MIEARKPDNEERRLSALHSLRLLDTPAEERFDRITRTAQRLFRVEISQIVLIDADRQWFKSSQGTVDCESSRSVSFCAHAILEDEPLVVPDAKADPRFADNPLVLGEPFIRFYAGCPIRSADGSKLGTLCLIDRAPRTLTAEEVTALKDLAAWAEGELTQVRLSEVQVELIRERDTLRRRAMIDALTQVWNRGAITEVLAAEVARAARQHHPLAVAMVDADHFKAVNDKWGHPAGDAVLRELAQRLRGALRPYDAVGRYGGEEFLVVLPDCDSSAARMLGERLRAIVAGAPIDAHRTRLAVTVSIGVATSAVAAPQSPEDLVALADAALYRAKSGGRNRVEEALLQSPQGRA